MSSFITRFNDRLRAWGMGERVIKTTLATMLAWAIGSIVPGGTDHPYFAPLAALLSFQVTIADSVTAAAQRVLGIVAGVSVALVITHLMGVSVWSIGLMIFVALVVGANLKLTPQGVSQVGVSALIVMFVGNSDSITYAGYRIVESVIGAVVGVGVNALLVPPNYIPTAQSAIQRLASAIGQQLRALSEAVTQGLSPESATTHLEQARGLNAPLDAAEAALKQANTSLKYNLLHRTQQSQLAQCRADLAVLEHTVIQVRSISRILFDTAHASSEAPNRIDLSVPGPLSEAYGAMLISLAVAVERLPDADSQQGAATLAEALRSFEACRDTIYTVVESQTATLTPATWMHLGVILASAERMSTDLAEALQPTPDDETVDD